MEGEKENDDTGESVILDRQILVQFKSESGDVAGNPFDMPISLSRDKLQLLCDALLQKTETVPYKFYVNNIEIKTTLAEALNQDTLEESEKVLEIVYHPQAVFKVRAVTRCTSTIEGHAEAVISVAFSPDGRYLASGSGDTTVRFWDVNTETPSFTCKAHKHWILSIAWSPNGKKLASACKNGQVCLWNPVDGTKIGRTLTGHKQWVTCLCWKPLHLDGDCRLLASCGKDGSVRIWDTMLGHCVRSLSSHTQCITCMRWGGTDLIYTASQDRTVKVWLASTGALQRSLDGHAHWVNTLALNTDYVMRTGAYDPSKARVDLQIDKTPAADLQAQALTRYSKVTGGQPEILVSGSDDFTLFMWHPQSDKKPVARLTGHCQLVNQVMFSPDTRLLASASFDKSVKLWCGRTGKFITSMRGHVSRVYQISWSADSRLLLSGSSDSTLKVWSMSNNKMLCDLPGHADEVYAVDWSPDGERVVSGGKDKVLKLWKQ